MKTLLLLMLTLFAPPRSSIFSIGELFELPGHQAVITDTAFSPDGQTVLSCDVNGNAFLWDAQTGARKGALAEPGVSFNRVAFSRDGKLAAVVGKGFVGLLDPKAGAWVKKFPPVDGVVFTAVAIADDASLLALGGSDAYVRFLDVATGELRDFAQHEWPLQDVKFLEGDRLLLSGDPTSVVLWNAATGAEVRRYVDTAAGTLPGVFWMTRVAFSDDGTSVIASSGNDAVVFNLATQELTQRLVGHEDEVVQVRLTGDRKEAITASRDHTTRFWSVDSGQELASAASLDLSFASALSVSPRGDRFVFASEELDIFGGLMRTALGVWTIKRNQ